MSEGVLLLHFSILDTEMTGDTWVDLNFYILRFCLQIGEYSEGIVPGNDI